MDFINIKNLNTSNRKVKRQHREWEKVFANHIPKRGLLSSYIKIFHNKTKDM